MRTRSKCAGITFASTPTSSPIRSTSFSDSSWNGRLSSGELDVADIPDAWNERMTRYLGLSTDGNFKDGCMQDVHWFSGAFGYFPTYTLGALMAAQWFATATARLPDLEAQVESGDFAPMLGWLRREIHGRGRLKTARELLTEVTGEPLNLRHFKAHLERRYLG